MDLLDFSTSVVPEETGSYLPKTFFTGNPSDYPKDIEYRPSLFTRGQDDNSADCVARGRMVSALDLRFKSQSLCCRVHLWTSCSHTLSSASGVTTLWVVDVETWRTAKSTLVPFRHHALNFVLYYACIPCIPFRCVSRPHALRVIPMSHPLYKSRRQNRIIITSFAARLAATRINFDVWRLSRSCAVGLQVIYYLSIIRFTLS